MIQLRGREKACEDAAGGPREHRHTSDPQKEEVGRGAARRLYLGLHLQEPFRLLPLQPVLDLGRLSFDVTPKHHREGKHEETGTETRQTVTYVPGLICYPCRRLHRVDVWSKRVSSKRTSNG